MDSSNVRFNGLDIFGGFGFGGSLCEFLVQFFLFDGVGWYSLLVSCWISTLGCLRGGTASSYIFCVNLVNFYKIDWTFSLGCYRLESYILIRAGFGDC